MRTHPSNISPKKQYKRFNLFFGMTNFYNLLKFYILDFFHNSLFTQLKIIDSHN